MTQADSSLIRRAQATATSLTAHGAALLSILLLAACVETPPRPIVQQPMTARPPKVVAEAEPTGGIFQSTSGGRYHPMFEDRRARSVGDTLIVTINENTSASKKSSTDASRASSSATIRFPSRN